MDLQKPGINEDVHYLKHEQIDKSRWDECIKNAFNGLIYAFSWYLDAVAGNWDALVNEDYSIVFPLTFKRKIGIYYLCQPPFAQQLGIFSLKPLSREIISVYLRKIPGKFKVIEINLNASNDVDISGYYYFKRITSLLNLGGNYDSVRNNYSLNTIRNIKKADRSGIMITSAVKYDTKLLDFFNNETLKNNKNASKKTFEIIKKLVISILENNKGRFYIATDKENNLCGCAFFIQDNNKSIYLFSSADKFARSNGAMHKLVDTFIKDNTEKNIVLDFEGSMVLGIARFYESFGAKKVSFLQIRKNVFPGWLKKNNL